MVQVTNKLIVFYKLSKGIIKYRDNISDINYKFTIPPISERLAIAEKAHLLGHFSAKSNEEELLKQGYKWHTLKDDVKYVCDNCTECLKHKVTTIFNHLTVALEVNGIFDRIGIDLVLGLPPTSEGFIGIVVIQEYLSKYPFAMPIRVKSAEEIASHLFSYISIFGPPKELLSDQGREFLNKTIQQLTTMVVVEHRITSSYHPRTNGQVKKLNHTIIQSLNPKLG